MSAQPAAKVKPTFRHRSNGRSTEPKCVECGSLWPCPIELLTHGGEPPASLQNQSDTIPCTDPVHATSVEFFEDGKAWCYRCHEEYEYQGIHEPYVIIGKEDEKYCMGCEQDWPCATQRSRELYTAYQDYLQTNNYSEDADIPFGESHMILQMPPKSDDEEEEHNMWALIGWDPAEPGKLYVADHTFDPIEADMYLDIAQSEGFWLVELHAS